MKCSNFLKRVASLTLCLALLIQLPLDAKQTLAERLNYKDGSNTSYSAENIEYYSNYSSKNNSKKYGKSGSAISIDLKSALVKGKQPEFRTDTVKGNVLYWTDETPSLTFYFNAENEGLYNIIFDYCGVGGNTQNILRGIRIDGEYPFNESQNIILHRRFTDTGKPEVNNLGDDVMPQQKENKVWLSEEISDVSGYYSMPLEFHITSGKHTITVEYIDQELLLSAIRLVSADKLTSYKQISADYTGKEKETTADIIHFEAEDFKSIVGKTSSSILIASDSDETCTPKSTVAKKYNYIGGPSWNAGNSITWRFNAEKAGLYKIALRSVQNGNNGMPIYRTVRVDGKIPFEEMAGYCFQYNPLWNTSVLGKNGKPYLFYLESGEHTLTLTAVNSNMTPVIQTITQANSRLQYCYQNIVMVTGQSPDLNYDYELDKSIATLGDDLQKVINLLNQSLDMLKRLTSKTTTVENSIRQSLHTLTSYKNNYNAIPAGLDDFTAIATSMGDWLTTLKASSLSVDYIEIAPPSAKLKDARQSLLNRIINSFKNLIISYTKDYNEIGSLKDDSDTNVPEIKVWISKSKEWAEILKNMVDGDFSQKNKAKISVNLLPEGAFSGTVNTLLLAVNAGTSPDIVLNMEPTNTAEYAVRGVIKNLKDYSDFENYRKYTMDELYKPVTYKGAVYALPESINFTVMFYRSDIFKRLGIGLPDTWNDVYNELLPKLNQYQLNMYIPVNFPLFFYQNGGEYYTKDFKKSALDSEAGYKAFEQFIGNYNDYGFPYNVSFYNRFRTGEIPIGIGGLSEYLQISYAASELQGKWSIAEIPAVLNKDGSKNRSTGAALATTAVIMNNTSEPDLSWKFLKWWMSAQVQSEYGKRLESRLGISARLSTANIEAFSSLPWNTSDLKVIKKSFEWIKEIPYVPGGYFTSRHITNAIARCITGNYTPRDSLEEAVEQINVELERKRADFEKE